MVRFRAEMYDKQGSLYHEPIYRGRREALEEQLQELYDGMRKNQLANLMKLESQRLQQALTAELPDILLTSKADTWAKVRRYNLPCAGGGIVGTCTYCDVFALLELILRARNS
jgi:hypothetical protein